MEVRSIEAIVRALNAAQVQYLIVGGLAVNAHGYERLTRDWIWSSAWSRTILFVASAL